MQLSATVLSRNTNFTQSLFERLVNSGYPKMQLKVQYRMHREIRTFPSEQFYSNSLSDSEHCAQHGQQYHEKGLHEYRFFDLDYSEEDKLPTALSKRNSLEAHFVVNLVKCAIKIVPEALFNIAIIAPYRAQVHLIRNLLGQEHAEKISVDTVDAFQGRESDIVILSCVRTSPDGKGGIGFLKDQKRLNVAITRARYCLWIVGNAKALSRADKTWQNLINDAHRRKLRTLSRLN